VVVARLDIFSFLRFISVLRSVSKVEIEDLREVISSDFSLMILFLVVRVLLDSITMGMG